MNGHDSTQHWTSTMSCGLTSAPFNSRLTAAFVAGNGASLSNTSQGKARNCASATQQRTRLYSAYTSFLYRAKHPVKVHVWAGISKKGPTEICIFEGKKNAPLYTTILDQALLPFLEKVYPSAHRFMQDNDPKHTSRYAKNFMDSKGINWWRTPPKSPDLNPIENLWHELKEYVRREVKPQTKEQLIDGIVMFWNTVDADKCQKYIGHLRKVIPKVNELDGAATGY